MSTSIAVAPPSTATVSLVVEAPIEVVWALVSDPVRLAACSPEVHRAEVGGTLEVGARFTGHNARGGNEWSVDCSVVEHDAPNRFAFHAGDDEVGTTWRFHLRDLGEAGTQVIESFDSLRLRHPEWIEVLAGRHAQLVEDMQATLAAVRDAVQEGAR